MLRRAAELAQVLSALGQAGEMISVLVSGDAGIGKTTLLDEVCATLDARTLIVRATGGEGELDLPLAGITDLLKSLRPDVDRLDEPHRSMLAAAIERGEPAAPVVLGLAVMHLLDDVARRHPSVLLVIDDVQWFDELSTSVIQFALRRLADRPIGVLVATRAPAWPGFDSAEVLRLAGVDDDTSFQILSRTGDVDPEVAARAGAACGGNPLALEQLGVSLSAAQRHGTADLPDVVPIGGRLAAVLADRLAVLPSMTIEALAVLAAAGLRDLAALPEAWRDVGASAADLAPAEDADVVIADGSGFRFTHPLLRTAALTYAGPATRRRAHRALAAAANDVDRRAHHLDVAAEGPDEEAAEALETVALRAGAARSYEVAAHAWERAARRSSTPFDIGRRLAEATSSYWYAGRNEPGLPLGREAVALLEPGPERVRLLFALGDLTFFYVDCAAGVRMILDEAEDIVDTEAAQSATMVCLAANLVALTGDLARASRLCADGLQRAHVSGDPITVILGEAISTHIGIVHGQSVPDAGRVQSLIGLVGFIDDDSPRDLTSLGQLVVFDLLTLSRWDDAAEVGRRVLVQANRHGLTNVEAFVHGLVGEVAWRRGRWIEARAESLIEHAFNEARPVPIGSFGHACLARVDAATGRIDDSRRNAALTVDHGRLTGMRVMEAWGLHALGLAALADGDADTAVDALLPIWELCLTGDIGAPGALWWQGDLIEAMWRSGRGDIARLVDQLERDAERTGSRWAAAISARGRGLIGHDVDALLASATVLTGLGVPFEAARSRALIGEIGDRSEHAHDLRAALDVFHRLGARPWSDRTAEMIGSTEPEPAAVINSLSRAELRVALLVGRGNTNREVADELFLSPRTVDSHLQRIYRKLELRSRTELALMVTDHVA